MTTLRIDGDGFIADKEEYHCISGAHMYADPKPIADERAIRLAACACSALAMAIIMLAISWWNR